MKKVKNNKIKESNNPLGSVKEGKIKKNKLNEEKKLKEGASKLEPQDLAPKIENANLKPINPDKIKKKNKKNKNKSANKQEGNQAIKVANEENETKKDKKSKKSKVPSENVQQAETPAAKDLTEAELKKIEKKKAKKLAQKLKKQQKKLQIKDNTKDETVPATTNGVDKNVEEISNKVLTKKEKKALKRQQIKEQKLAAKQIHDPAVEAATVFVGNLPVNTKRIQLIRLFKDLGPVNSIRIRSAGGKVLHKHKQRREAGSLNAYVVLKDKESAEKAVSLNGVEFKDRHLRITLATKSPKADEMEQVKRTVFVGNLKYTATEESLREIFSSCGEIDYVRCLRDGDKGCKGVAYICFKTPDAVGLALELNETIVDERPINVERYSVRKLGAKEAREAQAAKEVKSKKGAKQSINKKAKKEKTGQKKASEDDDEEKKAKKSEFRGVKVENLKKKQKSKKKKSNDQRLQLAKKIAPKIKTE
ncbi:uncharacterized protein ACRADG_005535 [Cochliomyia hominivorax]